eukprot:jgi/Botrbrau1/23268/Bobra.0102s0013.1
MNTLRIAGSCTSVHAYAYNTTCSFRYQAIVSNSSAYNGPLCCCCHGPGMIDVVPTLS